MKKTIFFIPCFVLLLSLSCDEESDRIVYGPHECYIAIESIEPPQGSVLTDGTVIEAKIIYNLRGEDLTSEFRIGMSFKTNEGYISAYNDDPVVLPSDDSYDTITHSCEITDFDLENVEAVKPYIIRYFLEKKLDESMWKIKAETKEISYSE